jgi:SET domain-containing protein
MNDKSIILKSSFYRNSDNKEEDKKRIINGFNAIILCTLFETTDSGKGLDKVYVKESKIHGLGVFAKKHIKKGSLITYYPAHYAIAFVEGRKNGEKERNIRIMPSQTVMKRGLTFDAEYLPYMTDINSYYSICGDPRINDNPGFLGHMMNDCAVGHSTLDNYNPKDEEVYMNVVLHKVNAFIKYDPNPTCTVTVTAHKDIKKDEEVLTAYGYHYWTQVNSMRKT